MEIETPGEHDEFSYDLKIPEERVAVLIGKDGETKKEIEENTGCKLDISKEGDVIITGKDALMLYTTREIVKAVARGFNPKTALLLLKQDYTLELIDLKDISGKSQNTLLRLKGRVIGKGGKSREEIERLTDTYISVYGKTIGIIGETSKVSLAHQAIGMLLEGSMHKTVFHFLEKKKKDMLLNQGF
ncbi:MAG: KH domain-containing protein [Nanoarchaeota archaeon]|nr:KH domain-containing protein [Nanoarchaeota archaeon]MBU1644398.1 KH domain-containing protein [Nanoarchaeota archaeon]MBU1976551.1 KH domain-containing protein [Nanoarchaeota archaeon]